MNIAAAILFLLTFVTPESQLSTGIFQKLYGYDHAFVGETLFLLDQAESQILVIDANSLKTSRLSRRGQGPGELENPVMLFVSENHIFVGTPFSWHRFTTDGTFVEKTPVNMDRFLNLPYDDGWFYQPRKKHPEFEFFLHTKDSKHENLLISFPNPTPEGERIKYAPAPRFHVNQQRNLAFISLPGAFEILVFDLNTSKMITRITKNVDPVPYKPEDTSGLFKNIVKLMPIPKTKDPDFFPPVNQLDTSPEGHVLVQTFDPRPAHQVYAFDSKTGVETTSIIDSKAAFERVIGVHNDYAFVLAFIDEEVTVIKTPQKELKQVLQRYPY